MTDIFISAGEVSGDIYGAKVVEAFKKLNDQDKSFYGMGGPALEARGVEIIHNPLATSTIGFALSKGKIRDYWLLAKEMLELNLERKTKLALLIDFSGYHLVLARMLHKAGIKVLHYIPAGVWFWGRWRASILAKEGLAVATIFPQEQKIYEKKGVEAHFVGHPLVGDLTPLMGQKKDEKLIALLPGSRPQELSTLLPEIFKAVELLQKERKDLKFTLALVTELEGSLEKKAVDLQIDIVYNGSRELLARAGLAIVASGTATLEAALLSTAAVIIYKVDKLTYFLGRLVKRVPYIGLPNLILGEKVLPELIQKKANGQEIFKESCRLLSRENQKISREKLANINRLLAGGEPAKEVARLLLDLEGRV